MQANQAAQLNFEQASAAASLGTSKQILADSTNSHQRGKHKSYGGNSFKNKRKGAYGNRREQYDENYDSRYNGQGSAFFATESAVSRQWRSTPRQLCLC